jgi:hypothetical protein
MCHSRFLAIIIFTLPLIRAHDCALAGNVNPADRAFAIAASYLRAVQARDFESAYHFISSADQKVQNQAKYVRSQANLHGFALALAKRLAEGMEVWPIEQNLAARSAHLEIGYRLPTGDELAAKLQDWNPEKLNRLSPAEQIDLLEAVEALKKNPQKILLAGRERVDLVLEKDGWKIHFDWPSRARVNFTTPNPAPKELLVEFLRNDFLVKPDEPFEVDFRLTNRTPYKIAARLSHRFEPRRWAGRVDMIACGLLAPLVLAPNETRELSSAYLLRGKLPAGTRVTIVYDFSAASLSNKRSPAS